MDDKGNGGLQGLYNELRTKVDWRKWSIVAAQGTNGVGAED